MQMRRRSQRLNHFPAHVVLRRQTGGHQSVGELRRLLLRTAGLPLNCILSGRSFRQINHVTQVQPKAGRDTGDVRKSQATSERGGGGVGDQRIVTKHFSAPRREAEFLLDSGE